MQFGFKTEVSVPMGIQEAKMQWWLRVNRILSKID